MLELSYEQKQIILNNFTRYCPGHNRDKTECRMMMQPLSTMCRNCGTRTEFEKVFAGSYLEHFETKTCNIANDTTFWYCIHPKMDSTLEELQQYCFHCITVELVKDGVQILKSTDPDI